MLLTISIQNEPLDGDILVFDQKAQSWKCVGKNHILHTLTKKTLDLEKQNSEMREEIERLKKEINEKLKSYHLILQNLTKGE